jgi:hypothetical protein
MDITNQLCSKETVRATFIYIGATKIKVNKPIICAVRQDNWKLHLKRRKASGDGYEYVSELYNLDQDISESNNVIEDNPQIVERLSKIIENYEAKFGDYMKGIEGVDVRSCGRVENPQCLTEYDENHPYIIAMYDKDDRG